MTGPRLASAGPVLTIAGWSRPGEVPATPGPRGRAIPADRVGPESTQDPEDPKEPQ